MTDRRSSRPIWLGEDQRRFDHFRVHLDVLKRGGMGVYEFAAYCALVAHAEIATGESRPSAATVASYFDAGERRIRDAVTWLETNRWIRIERVNGKASRYFVLPPPTPAPHADVDAASAAPDAGVPRHDMQGTAAPRADELEPMNENHGTMSPADAERASATALVRSWWEALEPRPAGNYIGLVKIVERLLHAGWNDREIEYALRSCDAVPTSAWLERSMRGRRSGRVPGARPAAGATTAANIAEFRRRTGG